MKTLAALSLAPSLLLLGLAPAACSSSSSSPGKAANGTVSAWQEGPALPSPRANHCSAIAGGYLVVIGGNYKPAGAKDFVSYGEVLGAKIQEDGSLGDWAVIGKTPSPVTSCTAAGDGQDVYLLDGLYDSDASGSDAPRTVYRATIDTAGKLGDFAAAGTMPSGARPIFSSAWVRGGVLYTTFSRIQTEGDDVALLTARVSPAGLDGWNVTSWVHSFRGYPQFALGSKSGYVLGGYRGGDVLVLADGSGASVDAAGTLGAPFAVPDLPKPTANGKAFVVDDYLFLVGGKDVMLGGPAHADVVSAKIAADGTIAPWGVATSLPEGRTNFALAEQGDFVYLTGGAVDAGAVSGVFLSRVRF